MSESLKPADSPGARCLCGGTHVRVLKAFRERWRRILLLTGDVETSLTYDAMHWGERVYLNGEVRARTSVWGFRNVFPRIEFTIPAPGADVSARIDVAASLNLRQMGITHFRLTVGRWAVYDEGPDGVRWPTDSEVIDGPVEWDC